MIRALTDRISQVEEDGANISDEVGINIESKVDEAQENSTKNTKPDPASVEEKVSAEENMRNFDLAFELHGAGPENLKYLRSVCYLIGSSKGFTPDDIDDITSTALRKMIKKGISYYYHRINPKNLINKDFKVYFYKFFFNAMNDLYREKIRRREVLESQMEYPGMFYYFVEKERSVRAGEQSPEDIVVQAEEQTLVRELIDELPPIYQDILLRRSLNQQSCKEVSEDLKIPIGTVKSRSHDARSELKNKVEKEASSIIPLNGNYRR